MDIIMQNPMVLLLALLLVMVFIASYVMPKINKSKQTIKKDAESGGDGDESSLSSIETLDDNQDGLKTKKSKARKKLKRLKPEIVRVFEKKQLQKKESVVDDLTDLKSEEEAELLKKMQFVKTSKTVSRLKPYSVDELNEKMQEELQMLSESEFKEPECDDNKVKHSHFDRTRRLSKIVEEDNFDDMFCSHISEKYMNMNEISKHIRDCDEMQNKLFERAAQTIADSQLKYFISEDGKITQPVDNQTKKTMMNEKRKEILDRMISDSILERNDISDVDYSDYIDEFDLSARNILLVDAILKRKGKINIKK